MARFQYFWWHRERFRFAMRHRAFRWHIDIHGFRNHKHRPLYRFRHARGDHRQFERAVERNGRKPSRYGRRHLERVNRKFAGKHIIRRRKDRRRRHDQLPKWAVRSRKLYGGQTPTATLNQGGENDGDMEFESGALCSRWATPPDLGTFSVNGDLTLDEGSVSVLSKSPERRQRSGRCGRECFPRGPAQVSFTASNVVEGEVFQIMTFATSEGRFRQQYDCAAPTAVVTYRSFTRQFGFVGGDRLFVRRGEPTRKKIRLGRPQGKERKMACKISLFLATSFLWAVPALAQPKARAVKESMLFDTEPSVESIACSGNKKTHCGIFCPSWN